MADSINTLCLQISHLKALPAFVCVSEISHEPLLIKLSFISDIFARFRGQPLQTQKWFWLGEPEWHWAKTCSGSSWQWSTNRRTQRQLLSSFLQDLFSVYFIVLCSKLIKGAKAWNVQTSFWGALDVPIVIYYVWRCCGEALRVLLQHRAPSSPPVRPPSGRLSPSDLAEWQVWGCRASRWREGIVCRGVNAFWNRTAVNQRGTTTAPFSSSGPRSCWQKNGRVVLFGSRKRIAALWDFKPQKSAPIYLIGLLEGRIRSRAAEAQL